MYQAWVEGEFDLLLSEETLDELMRVLLDPDVVRKLRITEEVVASIVVLLLLKAKLVRVTRKIAGCRDPHDDKFLEYAVAGNADYLVSEDKDLLSLRAIEGIPIVNLPTFWQKLQQTR